MELMELLKSAIARGGSDVFLVPGSEPMVKVCGRMETLTENRLVPEDTDALIFEAYRMAKRDRNILLTEGDDDFSFSVRDVSRFRFNAYRQRGSLAATCRMVAFGLPDPEKLHIPELVMNQSSLRSGMVLVTGPAGSGKSTTLACLVDRINKSRSGHIVTIEDPIEYLHPHGMSLVSQREVPNDAPNFDRALRAALRQAPDVIMLGEMRDPETIRTAITAAETGHLVLSSLHTVGAARTVDRIIDAFPAGQQQQIRVQLSTVLRTVISQQLVPTTDNGQEPVFGVMTVTPAIQTLIREGRTHQMDNAVFAGGADMLSMDAEMLRMVASGRLSEENALLFATSPETMERKFREPARMAADSIPGRRLHS